MVLKRNLQNLSIHNTEIDNNYWTRKAPLLRNRIERKAIATTSVEVTAKLIYIGRRNGMNVANINGEG